MEILYKFQKNERTYILNAKCCPDPFPGAELDEILPRMGELQLMQLADEVYDATGKILKHRYANFRVDS